ncbi:TniQ family protein [Desulfitobacterium sp.]|uniref:TniQ family protein n=1 Tax=Desulfitobacterium sp. TaxID=49981 RepID=UPI002B1F3EBF|nr:TniQ family protein [Desulfitobacterium sp.]MEA4900708.1 TniQ family protein [Desulfitobacterium sp.]
MEPLTIRVRPYPDEAISSFMFRLAEANGISMLSLWKLVREKRKHYAQRADITIIDFAPVNVINAEKLAYAAMIGVETVFQGSLYYVLNKFSLGERLERARFLSGVIRDYVAYCPICLNEHHYYKLLWRLNEIDICLKHKIRLSKNCHACNQIIEYKDVSILDECPYCHEKLSAARDFKHVLKNEYLFQKDLQDAWIQLLKPGVLKLKSSEVATRILYLANQKNHILDKVLVKNSILSKNSLSTILQQARGSLSNDRAFHISLVLNSLKMFNMNVNDFLSMEVPVLFVDSVRQPLEEKRHQYSCLAPWCINFGKTRVLVKTGTSFKRKVNGETLHYYLSCPECGCEYAVNQDGRLEERTYFIRGYYYLKGLFNNEYDLNVLAEKSGLSKDRVRRCYAYFRTRGLLSVDSHKSLEGWANKKIQIEEDLLNKVIITIKDCINLNIVKRWRLWESYDQFLTYRFHPKVVRAIIQQKRVLTKRGSKVTLEDVRQLLEELSEANIEISIDKVAQSLKVCSETLRSINGNSLIAEYKEIQRRKTLIDRAEDLCRLADSFFLLNQNKRITSTELYKYLGVSRPILWRTNSEITNQFIKRLREHNRMI